MSASEYGDRGQRPCGTTDNADEWAPPSLYVWDVLTGAGDHRAGGVTDERERALMVLGEAMRQAPLGSRGTVQRAELSLLGAAEYCYLNVVAYAWTEVSSGTLHWAG
ncbi:hypothetical protein EBO15_00480 [Actinomadura harenae]|uniref:Uncharacterized protein n=1 Tax=Actinomadura harenae TaxID=2483351 RepID=A0A3M2ME89_9ACTN|nr:hypothetical protein EBO15_00480 [Actinomadura harenae]